MKVKDILKMVCDFVGEKELKEKLSADAELSGTFKSKTQVLVDCFNRVNQEIASDYLPFLTTEQVEKDNIVLFSKLSKTVINIYEVKNRFNMNLKFKLFSNYIEVDGTPKTIVYSFLPEDITLEDEVEFFCGLSARVYAYGIASEYLLVEGISDDADIWEERFKESLFVLSRKRGEHCLPRRSWF